MNMICIVMASFKSIRLVYNYTLIPCAMAGDWKYSVSDMADVSIVSVPIIYSHFKGTLFLFHSTLTLMTYQ